MELGLKKYIALNPNFDEVLNYYKVPRQNKRSYMKHIIGHELGHEIDYNYLSDTERKDILDKIKQSGFTTDYLKTVRPNKYDREAVAEWLSRGI